MSYYQVAESCRLQTSDWNSKWDLSSLVAFGQNTSSSSAYTPNSISSPNSITVPAANPTSTSTTSQEPDFALLPPKLQQPHEYQHDEKPKTSDNTINLNNTPTFTDSAYGKFSGWSNWENSYGDDDCIPLTSYHENNYQGYSTHPFIKEEYVDDFIPSGSSVDTATGNWCNTFNGNEYEYKPNQINQYEGNSNGFSRDEIGYGSTTSQFRVSDNAVFPKNQWLMTPPFIKEEYDDDIVLLGAHNTNKDVFSGSTASQFKVSDSDPETKNLWSLNPPSFIKEEYDEDVVLLGAHNTNKDTFSTATSQFRVSDTAPCSKDLWLMTSPPIKEEFKDDVLTLGEHSTNKELKNNYCHSVYTDNILSSRNYYDLDEISNDSVELLFVGAGLEKIIESSPSDLLQTKEIKDLFSNDQISTQGIQQNKTEVEEDNIPIQFNRRYYKCFHCSFKTNKREQLNEHLEALHLTNSYNTRNTRSRRNQNSSNNDASKFNTEKLRQNLRIKSIKCSECDYTTNDSKRLKRHMEKKHYPAKVKRYSSWEQDSKYQPLLAIDESQDNNQASDKISGSKLYKCPDCTYKTQRKDYLKKHVKKAHSDESDENIRYSCFKSLGCNFESTYSADFYKHLKLVHFSEAPFKCEDCQYKSNKTTAFLAHRVIHTGDRPFNCIECDFSCRRKYHLTGHWISHKKEKKFKCSYCTKKYSYKCSKVRHEKTSCKQKPK